MSVDELKHRCPSGWPKMRSSRMDFCDECKGDSGAWFDGEAPKPIKHKPGCSRAALPADLET